MKNKKPTSKQIKNVYCEHHSNLALLTTAVAMITFMVLMIIYMGTHQTSGYNIEKINMARAVSKAVGLGSWIVSAVLCVVSVTKKKKYLAEYIIYALVMGFGLFFMGDMPAFIYNAFKEYRFASMWTLTLFRLTSVFAGLYFVVSVAWHLVLATPKKNKKK